MLNRVYEKSEVRFSVVLIILYVIANSYFIQLSNDYGMEMIFTIPFNILLIAVVFIFINKKGLLEYYGLCKVKTGAKNLLFYIPLAIIATVNIWMGICFKMDMTSSCIYFASMILTGIVEELLFRGFLYKAICRTSVKRAIFITSITFGIGHIVNLINGNGDKLETICQIFYAIAVGFLLAAVLYVGGSIIPCMITHSVLNALSTFSNEAAFANIQIPVSIVLCLVSVVSAVLILNNAAKATK